MIDRKQWWHNGIADFPPQNGNGSVPDGEDVVLEDVDGSKGEKEETVPDQPRRQMMQS